jgi:hypothetical protein
MQNVQRVFFVTYFSYVLAGFAAGRTCWTAVRWLTLFPSLPVSFPPCRCFRTLQERASLHR